MRNILRKHYKKIIFFGLAKKFLIVYFLFYSSFSFAEGTYNGTYFTSYEENATLYLTNYYDYQTFKDCYIGSTDSKNIIKKRIDGLYTDIQDLADRATLNGDQLHYLKQKSHLIDWNLYTDDFGMTLHQTNFIYALVGSLIGFTFLFFFIFILVSRVL